MLNIWFEDDKYIPISEGERHTGSLMASAIDDVLAGRPRMSEDAGYGTAYTSAWMLAQAEEWNAAICIESITDEYSNATVGFWILFGPGAQDEPPEPYTLLELKHMAENGVKFFDETGRHIEIVPSTLQ